MAAGVVGKAQETGDAARKGSQLLARTGRPGDLGRGGGSAGVPRAPFRA